MIKKIKSNLIFVIRNTKIKFLVGVWLIIYITVMILKSVKNWVKDNFEWLLVVLMFTIVGLLTAILI